MRAGKISIHFEFYRFGPHPVPTYTPLTSELGQLHLPLLAIATMFMIAAFNITTAYPLKYGMILPEN